PWCEPDIGPALAQAPTVVRLLRVQEEAIGVPGADTMCDRSGHHECRSGGPGDSSRGLIGGGCVDHLAEPCRPSEPLRTEERVAERTQNSGLTAERSLDGTSLVNDPRYRRVVFSGRICHLG